MAFDPTQQVPPPQGYPPQQPTYPSQPGYGQTQQQGYPPPQPTYASPPTYVSQPGYTPPLPTPIGSAPPPPVTYQQYSGAPTGPTAGGFDFNLFWRNLGLTGRAAGIGGAFLLLCFIFPWTTSPNLANPFDTSTETHSGFGAAASGVRVFTTGKPAALFPQLWLVVFGALALVTLTWFIYRRRVSFRLATISTIAMMGLAFFLELCFLIQINSLQSSLRAPDKTYYSAEWGFWLALLDTLAVLGISIFALVQERKLMNPPAANPYQPAAYPGSQPSAPYPPPAQYTGSQPQTYQYPGQPPPYPGQ